MFVVLLRYVKPLESIDSLLPAHGEFLERHFAAGHFLAAGRRVPRSGGVILARALDRASLERILAEDPFAVHGAAEYEVLEFTASRTAPGLEALRDAS